MPRVDPHNSSQYWWDRHLTGLSLMHADFTTHEYPLHTHDALVIAVTEQGGSIVKSRGELQDATHRDVCPVLMTQLRPAVNARARINSRIVGRVPDTRRRRFPWPRKRSRRHAAIASRFRARPARPTLPHVPSAGVTSSSRAAARTFTMRIPRKFGRSWRC